MSLLKHGRGAMLALCLCARPDLKCPCPARAKKFKFRDELPALRRRYRPRHVPSSPSPTLSSSSSLSQLRAEADPPVGPNAESVPLTIGEQVSPSLAVRAISSQQTQVYSDFVMCCFPCIFKCTENRVPVTCFEFVEFQDRRRGAMDTCFDWALRTITATYTGLVDGDSRFVEAGTLSCPRALRALAGALSDVSAAKSDEVLATAIGLAIFEKYACSAPDSWLRHAEGIKSLMRLRGPEAHLHGYGQAMYLAYRHFFITAALMTREESFLQGPEWQALDERLVALSAKHPDTSVYTDIVERGFREMVKTPGYVKQARKTLALPPMKRAATQSELLQNILASRATLQGVYTLLGVSISMTQADHKHGRFTGPISYYFFDNFSTQAMSGIRSGTLLLNHLLSLLDPKQRPAIEQENRALEGREPKSPRDASASLLTPLRAFETPPSQQRLLIEPNVIIGRKESMTTDWMDRVVTTMGMDGVRVSLLDE
ncbi:hypothetical protein PHISP_02671 [Aspergillus sp. HF37]|nr:hypothetical protein PHISP_02671 [Aspergillus sp. HF37]